MSTAQKILTAVEKSAILVGLTINKSQTEYMVCGEVTADVEVQEPVTLSVDAGPIMKVDDFRYLGGWLKSSDDDFLHRVPQAWQACNSMWRVCKCPTLSRDCKQTLFQATVGTVLLYNAETWTTTHALERRIDGVYTRLLRKALDVSWQQHMTNQELYSKIPSAMHQLREQRLTFAGHCYRCEVQPVKHLVLWEGRAGRMFRGQANRLTYVKQLLRDSCCETVDELQRMIKIGLSGQEYRIQLQAPND